MTTTKTPELTTISNLIAQYPKLSGITDVDVLMKRLSEEMRLSLAQIVARLVEEEQALILGETDPDLLLYDWNFWGRPDQLPPDDDSWNLYALVSGRGFGKTRTGAEWVHKKAMDNPKCRITLVGRTAADIRDVIVDGESGIAHVGQPGDRPEYIASKRRLVWPNGSMAIGFSAEEPDQLRGIQSHYAWGDEVAAWKHAVDDSGLTAWDNMIISNRLGDNPQALVTTTPKRTPFMFDLLKKEEEPTTIIVRGSTMDNAGNLHQSYIDNMLAKYGNTRLAEQELYGLMLEEIEGALWSDDLINDARLSSLEAPKGFPLTVIAVDPSVAENPKDECGIIVAGATKHRRLTDRHAFIIEDASLMGSPAEWAKQVALTWLKYRCPVIVEKNNGGSLVKNSIHAINADIPILEVWAHQGKQLRAEPVTLKYDQGRVHHIDYLPDLESQMLSWVPGESKKSPDRVDALVYAITALLIKPPGPLGRGAMRAKSMANRRLPDNKNYTSR